MKKRTDRREFISIAGILAAGAMCGKPSKLLAQVTNIFPSVAVVKGGMASGLTRRCVELLGGLGRFVKKGNTVVVKPNIGWDRRPEYAANTNPIVVAEVVKMCFEAGAAKVLVFDRSCNNPKLCYLSSGIAQAAENAGASVFHVVDAGFKNYEMPGNLYLTKWPLYSMAMEADCLINVPVAKVHGIAGLTLGMKNLMGIMGGDRGQIHWKIDQYLPELAAFVKPDLTIIDATRILVKNGPQGGNLRDVETINTVIASPDIGSADAYAATLFGMKPADIGSISNSPPYGLGETDVARMSLKVETI